MIRRKTLYVGLSLAILGLLAVSGLMFLSSTASAGTSGVLDDGKDLLPQAGISLEQAVEAAQTASSGSLGEVDLEYRDGQLVFNVDVGSNDVQVDAQSGLVLGLVADD